jgi:hypothetical protein
MSPWYLLAAKPNSSNGDHNQLAKPLGAAAQVVEVHLPKDGTRYLAGVSQGPPGLHSKVISPVFSQVTANLQTPSPPNAHPEQHFPVRPLRVRLRRVVETRIA